MELVVAQRRQLQDEELNDVTKYAGSLTLERVLREERIEYLPSEMPTLQHFVGINERALLGPGSGVELLRTILVTPPAPGRLIVLTVNFDTLLDDPAGGARVFTTDEQFAEFPEYLDEYVAHGGATPLLKLHGTIEIPNSIVANVEDTMPGLEPNRTAALGALMAKGRANLIYVGYSMRDLDLSPYLGQQVFGQFAEEMWVSPFPKRPLRRLRLAIEAATGWKGTGARYRPERLRRHRTVSSAS